MQPITPWGENGLTLEAAPRPATSETLFGNDRPLELEIGSGKGAFLVQESQSRKDVNFLGIEYQKRYFIRTADRLWRNGCTNARVVLAEAASFIRDFIPDDSLSAVHVYFPDPWPKRRHRKRRSIAPDFVELVAAKLKLSARLQILTDHREYFDTILPILERSTLAPAEFLAAAGAGAHECVGTNFERKYLRQGRALYAVAAEKPRRDV